MNIHLIRVACFSISSIILVSMAFSNTVYAGSHFHSDDYYPTYDPNPTVRQDIYDSGNYDTDGTYHSEHVEENRHDSYYSSGRNEAITRPRTTVETWNDNPDQETTRRQTSWTGADGLPHSTTVDSTTTTDFDGNTHTDTQVTLKSMRRPK